MAGYIGDHRVGAGGNHHRADGQAVQTVGQVDRVGRADDDQSSERNVVDAEIGMNIFNERNADFRAEPRQIVKRRGHAERDAELADEFCPGAEPFAGSFRKLQIIVDKPYGAETYRA